MIALESRVSLAKPLVVDQRAVTVAGADHRGVAVWTEYEIDGRRYTEVVVLAPERTLLPRDRIAHGVRAWERNVAREALEPWLARVGYEVLAP